MIAVTLPVGVPDPAERLRHIVAETSCRKQTADGGVAGIVAMPAMLARVGVRCARHTAAGHINLYVTNVPGPPCPLYLAGARVRDVVPLAPLVAGVRLSVTALSYDGVLSVALLADEALIDFPALTAGARAGLPTYLGDVDREISMGGPGHPGTGTAARPPEPRSSGPSRLRASDRLSGSRHQEG